VRRALLYVSLALIIAALGVLAGGYLYVTNYYGAAGPLGEPRSVVLERGSSARAIALKLEDAGVIIDGRLFLAGLWLEGGAGELKPGEYAFEAGISPRAVAEKLIAGDAVVRKLTIAEGLTVHEIVALVAAADGLEGVVNATMSEGTLLPETYHYAFGDGRGELLARMHEGMTKLIEELWPKRAAELPLDTAAEAVILASIVEKETGVAAERARVAGVFVNRLKRGMPLQSDPTVIYALTKGEEPLARALSRADLALDSPFNTYRNKGLPPAPIANPGRAALEAALNPAETDALYFVADGSGGHAFAKTLAEHNQNVARWKERSAN
jgi:UPF0755 protein